MVVKNINRNVIMLYYDNPTFIHSFLIFFYFLTALLTITHVTYNKINNREEMKYICIVI